MRHLLLIITGGAMLLGGCDSDSADLPSGYDLRCGGAVGASIVALEEATLSGTVSIVGSESNAVLANAGVTLSGNVYSEADILSGTTVTQNGGSLDIRGEIVEGADTVRADPDEVGAARAAESNNNDALRLGNKSPIRDGELRLSGKSVLEVPGGTYYFPNGMSVSGQAELILSGDAEIFVAGPVSITGTTYTNDASPYKLEVISVGTDTIRLAGTSEATLHISAPLADVSLSGTTAFDGTILGLNVRISGTADLGNSGDALRYDVECEDPSNAPPDPLPDQQS